MEIIIAILLLWWIARIFGRVFDGPRYRRRRRNREYRNMRRYATEDAYRSYETLRVMREYRRGR